MSSVQAAVNYASSDLGAKIIDSASSSANPEGVLSEREEAIWSAKAEDVLERPYVIVQLPPHPAIRFVGWHVWQDYASNPKIVEIAAGMSPTAVTDVVHCTALQGPGIQLWELSTPISSAYSYVRFRIMSTFGSSSTYMNRVFLFSQRPPEPSGAPVTMSPSSLNRSSTSFSGASSSFTNNNNVGSTNVPSSAILNSSSYSGGAADAAASTRMMSNAHHFPRSSTSAASAASGGGPSSSNSAMLFTSQPGSNFSNSGGGAAGVTSTNLSSQPYVADPRASMSAYEIGSPMHMSEMLKELDEDIRMLHPLPVDDLVAKTAHAAAKSSRQNSPQAAPFNSSSSSAAPPSHLNTSHFQPPAASSEVEELRREIRDLRSQVGGRSSRSPNSNSSATAAGGGGGSGNYHHPQNFPQEELASLVDDIMQPKLMKWARKLESRILMKVDETLKDLLGQITAAIDARVEQHMRHVIREHHREHGGENCHVCSHHESHHTGGQQNNKERRSSSSSAAAATTTSNSKRKESVDSSSASKRK